MDIPNPNVVAFISPDGEFFIVPSEECHSVYSWHELWSLKRFGTTKAPEGWIRQGFWKGVRLCLSFDLPRIVNIDKWQTLSNVLWMATNHDVVVDHCGKVKNFTSREFKESGAVLSDFIG